MIYRTLFPLLVAVSLAGCPKPSPVPNTPDASDAGPDPTDADPDELLDGGAPVCVTACARLRRLGCPEGSPKGGDTCVQTCERAAAKHTVDLKPACVAKAKSQNAVRECGTVTCPATLPVPAPPPRW